jgi:hypothetical protein
VCAYTIIDHSKYVNKAGIEVTSQKRLLVVKPSVMNKLARRREQCEGDLTYAVFEFARDSKDECSTGEDITFRKRLSTQEILQFKPDSISDEEWLKPFDYLKLFAPKPIEALRQIAGQAPPVGAGTGMPPAGGSYMPPPNSQACPETDINALLGASDAPF